SFYQTAAGSTDCWYFGCGREARSVCASGACGGAASHGWISSERDRHRPSAACRRATRPQLCERRFCLLRIAAVEGFHENRRTQAKGDISLAAQVGQPVPGEDALYGDGQVLSVRGNRLEE